MGTVTIIPTYHHADKHVNKASQHTTSEKSPTAIVKISWEVIFCLPEVEMLCVAHAHCDSKLGIRLGIIDEIAWHKSMEAQRHWNSFWMYQRHTKCTCIHSLVIINLTITIIYCVVLLTLTHRIHCVRTATDLAKRAGDRMFTSLNQGGLTLRLLASIWG